MKTFFSENHKLRDANTELYGGELVKPFERPQRLDFIVEEIKKRDLGEILSPNKIDLNIINKVHDHDYIKFYRVFCIRMGKNDIYIYDKHFRYGTYSICSTWF